MYTITISDNNGVPIATPQDLHVTWAPSSAQPEVEFFNSTSKSVSITIVVTDIFEGLHTGPTLTLDAGAHISKTVSAAAINGLQSAYQLSYVGETTPILGDSPTLIVNGA